MTEPDPICRHVRENLSAYLDGELKGDARQGVEEHLAGCDACRRHLEELKDTWRLLDDLEAPIVPRSFHDQVLARVETEEKGRPVRRLVRRLGGARVVTGLAATAAAAVFILGLYVSSRPMGDVPTPQEVECITYLDLLQDVETIDNMDKVKSMRELGHVLPSAEAPAAAEGDS